MKKISLIIPVYNVEKYVAKCIHSCINQNISIKEYEIVIINDGSTDNSLEIINEIANKCDNITVFSQQNLGLSAARNKGMELALGEYLWFIDSDDWIEENCLERIIDELKEIDVLALGYIMAYDNPEKNSLILPTTDLIKNGIDLLKSKFITPAQFYIYRKSFLLNNALQFYPGVFHEDFEFTPRMLYLAKRVKIDCTPAYFFYKRHGSITTTVNPKKSFDLIQIALNLIIFEKKNVIKKHKYIYHNIIWLAINNALYNSVIMNKKEKHSLNREFYLNKWIFSYLKLTTIKKYKIERVLFLLFTKHTIIVYKLLTKFKT